MVRWLQLALIIALALFVVWGLWWSTPRVLPAETPGRVWVPPAGPPADVLAPPFTPRIVDAAEGSTVVWQDTSNADLVALLSPDLPWPPVLVPRPADGAVALPLPPAIQDRPFLACRAWQDTNPAFIRWWSCQAIHPTALYLPLIRGMP